MEPSDRPLRREIIYVEDRPPIRSEPYSRTRLFEPVRRPDMSRGEIARNGHQERLSMQYPSRSAPTTPPTKREDIIVISP
jgi:hypothetical protein